MFRFIRKTAHPSSHGSVTFASLQREEIHFVKVDHGRWVVVTIKFQTKLANSGHASGRQNCGSLLFFAPIPITIAQLRLWHNWRDATWFAFGDRAGISCLKKRNCDIIEILLRACRKTGVLQVGDMSALGMDSCFRFMF